MIRTRIRLATLAVVVASLATAAPVHATPAVQPTQAVVTLLADHRAFAKPARTADPRGMVRGRRPLTGGRTVLPVLGVADGWLHVRLPGRPNSHTGWIEQRATTRTTTRWHLVIDTARRRLTVYRDGLPVRTVKAIVGKAATPTPSGEFFVEEDIALRPTDAGAPYALALSARSNVLQEFNGGPGQIGLHGLAHIGGVLGTAASHGCVRLDRATLGWLVTRIGPGAPVTITG